MTEEEAREWVLGRFGADRFALMERMAGIVIAETARQNLISPSTISAIWNRHIVDSAQLLAWGDHRAGTRWMDIGSGAGFPGVVIAALGEGEMILVEVRKRRAVFLTELVEHLGLTHRVSIICGRVEGITATVDTISARAVAPLADIFASAIQCASGSAKWILPKGRSAREEVESVRQAWHGVFHVEHSITDPESLIVLASGVIRRGRSQ